MRDRRQLLTFIPDATFAAVSKKHPLWDCTNSTPEVAGLDAVIDRLLALPGNPPASALINRISSLSFRIPSLLKQASETKYDLA